MSTDVRKVCGIIMPISGSNEYSAAHWADIKDILADSIASAGFDAMLVSDADTSGVIHKRIVQNLYDNPIVVCDVSSRNANVMFELGMRLAFDKPTIIVKDDVTPYSFDTSSIEHIEYPKDLRFSQILTFKERLCLKISATFSSYLSDKSYSSFLKNFGQFSVAKLDEKEISGQEFALDEIKNLRLSFDRLAKQLVNPLIRDLTQKIAFSLPAKGISIVKLKEFVEIIRTYPGVDNAKLIPQLDGRNFVRLEVNSRNTVEEVKNIFGKEFLSLEKDDAGLNVVN